MDEKHASLRVPAEAVFARSVRMTAATFAVSCDMSVEDVEDVRMIAEEGFVYTCATAPESVEVRFVTMDFSLGDTEPSDESVDLVRVLLSAVCDEFAFEDDGSTLHLVRASGESDGE